MLAYKIDGVTGALTFINSVSRGVTSTALVPVAGSMAATLQSLKPPEMTSASPVDYAAESEVTLDLSQQFSVMGCNGS